MIVGIIPARIDSKRFPKKILADIDGKPMVVHVAERAMQSKLLEKGRFTAGFARGQTLPTFPVPLAPFRDELAAKVAKCAHAELSGRSMSNTSDEMEVVVEWAASSPLRQRAPRGPCRASRLALGAPTTS